MKKNIFKILSLLLIGTISVNAETIYSFGNEVTGVKKETKTYEATYIKHMLDMYEKKIPVYINEYTDLIGIHAPTSEAITLEYLLEEEEIVEKYMESNKEDSTPYTSVYSKKIKKYFKNNLADKNRKKCLEKFYGQYLFDSEMSVVFNYYMGNEFYTGFVLNKETCKLLYNRNKD